VQHRQDPALADLGRRGLEQQRDRTSEQQQRWRHQGQQQVLDHVQREQRRVVLLDARVERDQDDQHAGHEEPGPAGRHGVRGLAALDAPDAGPPQEQHDDRRQPHERVERPAEEQPQRVGLRRRLAPVGQGGPGGRGREHGRERRPDPGPGDGTGEAADGRGSEAADDGSARRRAGG
jgi:hypothetical protein